MKLYDLVEPNKVGYLKVSGLHTIYYEESGNPNGVPILYVHGGPGGGTTPSARQYFDPNFYRIIVFDQRGCGKSTPSSEIKENTTQDLINDIEMIRKTLNIDKWILFGGSWGSCLSLLYAINFPNRVNGLILRGVFLGRKEDDYYLYQRGASFYFPEAYEEFSNFIPENERKDLIKAYHKYLNSKNKVIAEKAAYHWTKWELGLITLYPMLDFDTILEDRKANLELAKLENHYFVNHIFLDDDNFILNNIKKIENIKTIIIHGRYDMDCRPEGAYLLSKSLKNCSLKFIIAGHSSKEIAISEALVDATEDFKNTFI
ncbi:prolyl aminopeptidase [Metamycoplasma buccale]|uniref:prolyl aminopeptidase n=1 Tax=Metamycoplasma buccale TaxID=55602 RepID=UPI00398F7904